MTRTDDVTPERLAELADGAQPRDAAERELMALMAEVRALEEPAPDPLGARVRAMAAGEAAPGRVHWWQEGRRRLLLVAAPVAAAAVALAIAIPVMTGGSGDTSPSPAGATSDPLAADSAASAAPESSAGAAAPDAPGAARAVAPSVAEAAAPGARLRLKVGDEAAAVAATRRARAEVTVLGGAVVSESGDGRVRRLVVRVPSDRAADALVALGRLGKVTGRQEAEPSSAGEVTIRVTITAGG